MKSGLLVCTAGALIFGAQSQGTSGIEAARHGGVVIVCRHSATESADENEQTLKYDDPSTQRRLSPEGERQALDFGKAFRLLGIQLVEVIASPMQRAKRTAELAFGRVRTDSLWHTRGDYYGGPKQHQRSQVLGQKPRRGTRIIISHIGTIYSNLPSIRGKLEEGDCVVVRPQGDTRFEIIEVVPLTAWMRAAGIREQL